MPARDRDHDSSQAVGTASTASERNGRAPVVAISLSPPNRSDRPPTRTIPHASDTRETMLPLVRGRASSYCVICDGDVAQVGMRAAALLDRGAPLMEALDDGSRRHVDPAGAQDPPQPTARRAARGGPCRAAGPPHPSEAGSPGGGGGQVHGRTRSGPGAHALPRPAACVAVPTAMERVVAAATIPACRGPSTWSMTQTSVDDAGVCTDVWLCVFTSSSTRRT